MGPDRRPLLCPGGRSAVELSPQPAFRHRHYSGLYRAISPGPNAKRCPSWLIVFRPPPAATFPASGGGCRLLPGRPGLHLLPQSHPPARSQGLSATLIPFSPSCRSGKGRGNRQRRSRWMPDGWRPTRMPPRSPRRGCPNGSRPRPERPIPFRPTGLRSWRTTTDCRNAAGGPGQRSAGQSSPDSDGAGRKPWGMHWRKLRGRWRWLARGGISAHRCIFGSCSGPPGTAAIDSPHCPDAWG